MHTADWEEGGGGGGGGVGMSEAGEGNSTPYHPNPPHTSPLHPTTPHVSPLHPTTHESLSNVNSHFNLTHHLLNLTLGNHNLLNLPSHLLNLSQSNYNASLNLSSHLNLTDLHPNLTDLHLNLSHLLNLTQGLDLDLIHKFEKNRRVSDTAFLALVLAYSLLMALGATGNSFVVLAVVRKPAMRTARNVFIINLAISDLLLCLVTMPLTLMELLTQYWPLGDTPFACSMVGSLQATSIFVSTISITAIALDRYHVIVYPTKTSLQKVQAVGSLLVVWAVSFILALPNFLWRRLENHHVNLPGLEMLSFCFEDWPLVHGRAYYSILVMVVQYCLPIVTVSIAYARICRKLKYRMTSDRSRKEDLRMRKTHKLLVSIALIFCLSWLPLNLYNVVVDLHNPFGSDTETMLVVYAVCHMAGMSSACSNPLLYGWLNDNFRKEFLEIFGLCCPCCPRPSVHVSRSSSSRASHPTKEISSFRSRPLRSRPAVMFSKGGAANQHTCNGVDLHEPDVTLVSHLVATTTL